MKEADYMGRPHVIFQNTTDILDPSQLRGSSGIEAQLITHLLSRSVHMARTGDVVVAGEGIPRDFVDYIRAVTGQDFDVASFAHQSGSPLFTRDIMGAIDPDRHSGKVLNPYLQWGSVSDFARQSGIPNAFTDEETIAGGLVKMANDKAFLYEQARGLEIPQVPGQQVFDPSRVSGGVLDMLQEWGGVFIQGNLSGGGLGNLDVRYKDGQIQSGKLGSLSEDEIEQALELWARRIHDLGSSQFIVAPLLDVHASHTVSGFVPARGDGEPFVYGVFGQVLQPVTQDYAGFVWPASDPLAVEHGMLMQDSTLRWLQFLQDAGYVGPSDLDFIVGSHNQVQHGERFLGVSESNTRWDGFRFGMQHVGDSLGANPRNLRGVSPRDDIGIKTLDHVATRASSTDEVVAGLQGKVPLFGLDNESEGAIIMVPPNNKGSHYETGIAVISDSVESAELMHNHVCTLIS